MKIASIFVVWDDVQLLERAIKNIQPVVDGVIVVYSTTSNYGEISLEPFPFHEFIDYVRQDPDLNMRPVDNERFKRNVGLNRARELGYTHFIMADADEFYEKKDFLKEKERLLKSDLVGLVCRVKTYFKLPTLTIGYDVTLVPFIHKLTPDLRFTWNVRYPFAFEGAKKEIRIDPTRQMNLTSGVGWSEITMHHYSYIRPDIQRKIRNSTARPNIENSNLVEDFTLAAPGYFCQFYKKTLEPCSDIFRLCTLPFITGLKT